MRKLIVFLIVVFALVAGAVQLGNYDVGPVLITREDEQKLVFVRQSPRGEATEPGMTWRTGIPLIETVKSFDRRWLFLDSDSVIIQTRERVPLQVDNYVIWRIADPRTFDRSFPGGVTPAEARIDREVNARVREILGTKTLDEVVTTERAAILEAITEQSREALAPFGIEVGDVHIVRTDLPDKTLQNVYDRMRAERERLAREFRAKGDERAREIRAEADKEARILVAKAREKAERARGEGDARAAAIYAEAYNADPEFYGFVRSLEAYRKTLGEGDTLVLPPDHEFFGTFQAGGTASP